MKQQMTDEAVRGMRSLFRGTEFRIQRMESGDWMVEIDDDVWTRIERQKLPNETFSDVVLRAIRMITGGK